uniref:Uncharacterized protein n=1 Tax=Haptolina brevifila TaxID=156173 RepID=A0A7S2G5E7_9EUKA|mmetsp:Transcript_26322/g.52845  ORF Transcript_26322/g.52845 Transcript_26322/m.52845 type:complete len:1068 (+) Transcript_26322:133-3336(+)
MPHFSCQLVALLLLMLVNALSALHHEHAGRRPLGALQDHELPVQYNEYRFRRRVDLALESVRNILATTRRPTYAQDTPHVYDDKYGLAGFLTTTSIAAQLNVLESLGLGQAALLKLVDAAGKGHAITMRLHASEQTVYLREATRDVSDGKVHKHTSLFGTTEDRVVTRVTEYFWRHEATYQLLAFIGVNVSKVPSAGTVMLQQRTAHTQLVTTTRESPRPQNREAPPIDVPLSWLLQQLIPDSLQIRFQIDKKAAACRTPRRNPQVDGALMSAAALHKWATSVHNYFSETVDRTLAASPDPRDQQAAAQGVHPKRLDLGAISEHARSIFVPVLPLFEGASVNGTPISSSSAGAHAGAAGDGGGGSGGPVSVQPSACATPVLPRLGDVHAFLSEQRRTLHAASAKLEATFPARSDEGSLISEAEAKVCVFARHLRDVLAQFSDSVDYIEEMLTQQLKAALGKRLTDKDFAQFMVHHEARLYQSEHAPRPFTFAVRRPGHSPEGVVAIEGGAGAITEADPVRTISRELTGATERSSMSFRLNAATTVTFEGERHLHAYLAHQFDDESPSPLRLTARARQFSSFLLLLGRLGPARTFEPSHAIIVKDKDELSIPLLLEQLPTPKAFRDAIASLSPEQQRFAKALRSMQLEGSVFGVLLLQLKPQLEKVLNLPPESLTKEISLTQSLLELFIEYQIPSDLLSYDGDASTPAATKLQQVKLHVKAITDMIGVAKAAEVGAAKQGAAYEHPLHATPVMEEDDDAEDGAGRAKYKRSSRSMARPTSAPAHAPERQVRMARMAAAPMMRQRVEQDVEMADDMAASEDEPMKAMAGPALAFKANAAPVPVLAAAAVPLGDASASAAASVPVDGQAVHGKPSTSTSTPTPTSTTSPSSPSASSSPPSASAAIDFTVIPQSLDAAYGRLDADSAIRPTRITIGDAWTKHSQPALLAAPRESTLGATEQKQAQQKAFDLLDALSRSGALTFDAASLHVLVAATHAFDRSLTETVIAQNVNPIEKLERSSLIIASTIHGFPHAMAPPATLLSPEHLERVAEFSAPALLPGTLTSSQRKAD